MTDVNELTSHVRNLFLAVFSTNCAQEGSEISQDEVDAINEFDVFEILENLKEIINRLFLFKKECLTSEKAELVKRSEQFEKMLQKLEAEVRSHIRTEHELKLHLETIESHSEELKQQNNKQVSEIKELQDKLKYLKKTSKPKDLTDKLMRLEELVREKNEIIRKMEKDFGGLRMSFTKSDSDKNLGKKSREKFEEIKHKIGEKVAGVQNMQGLFKDKVKVKRDRNQLNRKSANYVDSNPNKIALIKISSNLSEKKNHNRSISEYMRPKSAKRRAPPVI